VDEFETSVHRVYPSAPVVGQTISHYRLTAELGAGGMGVVYRADDLRLGRQVAIKLLPPGAVADPLALERFRREARAASALSHRHICTIHDIDEYDGRPFIVMEALEGETLQKRIGEKRPSLNSLLNVMVQVVEGLEAAHAKGIVHRDIKPSNIFVTDTGEVKILDFGLAKIAMARVDDVDSSDPTVTSPAVLKTRTGLTMGTISFMSPEQVRGDEVDARTDIFSCGVVMYEMATGMLPFRAATIGLIFDAILHKRPEPASSLNPELPAELDRILDKALEKDRDERYQSVRDLRAALVRLQRDMGFDGSHDAPSPRTWRARRRIVAATIALALAAVVIVGYFGWNARKPAAPNGPRALSRVTFEDGLQAQPTWSPDGRFIAYASDQGGNVDIWVQPLAGGRAIQITTNPAADWQPAWSPDGNQLAFRSEREGGGIFVAPAFGGHERRLTTFGTLPQWTPDGSRLLFIVRPALPNATVFNNFPVYSVGVNDAAPPKRILEDVLAKFHGIGSMALHPDGKRILVRGIHESEAARGGLGYWVVSLSSEIAPVNVSPAVLAGLRDNQVVPFDFRWSPSGDAIYFAGGTRGGVVNLWKVKVDRSTLEWVSGPERLTTGIGPDGDLAPSPDGSKVAFVTRSETVRAWALPFDAVKRRVTGEGQPVTRLTERSMFDLSADGRWLVSTVARQGKPMMELWSRSLETGAETMIGESPSYFAPRLSRDGAFVAYRTIRPPPKFALILCWMKRDGGEEHTMPAGFRNPYDWSPDAARILHTCPDSNPPSICVSPRDATGNANTRTVVADQDHALFQGRFSPDGKWIAFNAQSIKSERTSLLGVVRAAGGKWTALTDASLWVDKPRWAPDGRTIYFISNRQGGFFDVWGLPFDPVTGRPAGEQFQVTHTGSPGRSILADAGSEIGVSTTRLVVPIRESKGSVWLLDGVSR
jgi:eukaryotic-like serine/threonine-protein kinase